MAAEAAFSQLVELSSHSNVKLREVAAQVVSEVDRRGRELPHVAVKAGLRSTG